MSGESVNQLIQKFERSSSIKSANYQSQSANFFCGSNLAMGYFDSNLNKVNIKTILTHTL